MKQCKNAGVYRRSRSIIVAGSQYRFTQTYNGTDYNKHFDPEDIATNSEDGSFTADNFTLEMGETYDKCFIVVVVGDEKVEVGKFPLQNFVEYTGGTIKGDDKELKKIAFNLDSKNQEKLRQKIGQTISENKEIFKQFVDNKDKVIENIAKNNPKFMRAIESIVDFARNHPKAISAIIGLATLAIVAAGFGSDAFKYVKELMILGGATKQLAELVCNAVAKN